MKWGGGRPLKNEARYLNPSKDSHTAVSLMSEGLLVFSLKCRLGQEGPNMGSPVASAR